MSVYYYKTFVHLLLLVWACMSLLQPKHCVQAQDKMMKLHRRRKCSPLNLQKARIITGIRRNKCRRKCLRRVKCLAFQHDKNENKCWLLFYSPNNLVMAAKNFICSTAQFQSESPTNKPSPADVTVQPSTAPMSSWISEAQWLSWGRVDFDSLVDGQFTLQSDAESDVGVVITSHAFNGADVDFMVEYNQDTFENIHSGYEAQPYIFFAPTGTYPDTLIQNDNQFGDFLSLISGYTRSKIFSSSTSPLDYTYFKAGNRANVNQADSIANSQFKSLSLRIRRYNQELYAYYRLPESNDWFQIGSTLPLPEELKDIPLQFGVRVKKEWKTLYNFRMRAQKLAGGEPIPIPTKAPTLAPTETKTWIRPETLHKPPSCPTNLDRSSLRTTYETRGIGGGGAMSGLSISPWNSLWFLGTDMGTLFRSTDSGKLWFPVDQEQQTFTSHLQLSGPVGYTSDPDTVVFASCKNLKVYKCVARRSIDAGLTWNPINVTGGTLTDSMGNPALDYTPLQWVGSLDENSDVMFVTMRDGGGVYRSTDNGLNWNKVLLPFDDDYLATGLFFDQSFSPPYVYFATTQGIYMWEDGHENMAREIWSPIGGTMIQSFTGSRTLESGRLTLAIVDNDVTACENWGDSNCGFIHIYSAITNTENVVTDFALSKTSQKAFRVVSSPTDATTLYATGARSWPQARGTAVWVGTWTENQNDFSFTLKFLQSDIDNSYAYWPREKLDYSAVGLDVGYWDAGYYTFNVNPKNSSEAGGSGNFFLHVTKSRGEHWESPFTEHADSCNTQGIRMRGQRWRSTGLEMTSVRWLKFNPYNTTCGFASVADIRMLRTDDYGESWEISGGTKSGLISINTLYDFAFAGPYTIFGVGGNFHDWPHEWYKNKLRGAGGAFISIDSGSNWRRLGSTASKNCNSQFLDVDCSLKDDMIRQILSTEYDSITSTLYIGSQSAGIARLRGLEPTITNGTFEELDAFQWEWINNGLGSNINRIVPEIKLRNGKLYCLLTGDAPDFTNQNETGIYEWDESNFIWIHRRTTVIRPPNVHSSFDLWAYPTGFEIDDSGSMWLIDMEANWNYLASGIWKSIDGGETWNRMQQFTFPYHVVSVGSRIHVSGAKAWGEGGLMHSDDGGETWIQNEDLPLKKNANSAVIDPRDHSKIFYTFFGGGMMHGPSP